MAITQISRIQHRRGLQQDLPQLASAEFGWSVDTRKLYIGNGTIEEGAPTIGVTEILTEHSEILTLTADIYSFKGLMATGVAIETGPSPTLPIRRTVQDKFDDIASVRDFGAIANGVVDDTAAINRALSRVFGNDEGMYPLHHHRAIYFPSGKYRITGTINIPPYTRIYGESRHSVQFVGEGASSVTVTATGSENINNTITVDTTVGLRPGMQVRFSGTTFGGIVAQRTYYVTEITDDTHIVLSTGSAAFVPTNDSGSMTGHFSSWPVVRFVDRDGRYGQDFEAVSDTSEQYHISDITITFVTPTYDQPGLVIDGGSNATFTRCRFQGMTDVTGAEGINAYDELRGNGISLVAINNDSQYTSVQSLSFNDCEFLDHQFGIELNNGVTGVSVSNCFFDHLYHGVIAGQNSEIIDTTDIHDSGTPDGTPDNIPTGVTISGSTFKNVAYEAIKTYPWVTGVMSVGNRYLAVGVGDGRAPSPIYGTGLALVPAISWSADNNYSVADYFVRNELDLADTPTIDSNGYTCFILGQDTGLTLGKDTRSPGTTVSLIETPTWESANIALAPNYNNLTFDYVITYNDARRIGTMKVTHFGNVFVSDEEYVTSGATNVDLQANVSTGDIEYKAIDTSADVILTYSIRQFN